MSDTVYKRAFSLVYSIFLLVAGGHVLAENAKARNLPIGEMVSRGEVRFEAKLDAWKPVEPFHFPVFKGVKLKTEKGVSVIALANQSQVEMKQHSLVSFNQEDQMTLLQGGIHFRIPASAQMSLNVGNLSIIKSVPHRTANHETMEPNRIGETIGSTSIRQSGSLAVKSIRGTLSILDQDQIVLASLGPGDILAVPSAIVFGRQKDDEIPEEGWVWEDIEEEVWPAILLNAGMIGGISKASSDDDDDAPFCP